MRLRTKLKGMTCCLALVLGHLPQVSAARSNPALLRGVHVYVGRPVQQGSLFRWRIRNDLDTAVFVYDFFLWGPALHINETADKVVFETAPVSELRSCPPNRFPPVLLLVIGPGRTIEGDFLDSAVESTRGKPISLQISVGSEPYSVVSQAKRFYNSNCQHNPYDAIVQWGTLIESAPTKVSSSQ
jgi:hypothetical protein